MVFLAFFFSLSQRILTFFKFINIIYPCCWFELSWSLKWCVINTSFFGKVVIELMVLNLLHKYFKIQIKVPSISNEIAIILGNISGNASHIRPFGNGKSLKNLIQYHFVVTKSMYAQILIVIWSAIKEEVQSQFSFGRLQPANVPYSGKLFIIENNTKYLVYADKSICASV